MQTEIKLYSGIYSYVVERIMDEINAAKGDITMRINSPGGSVFDGWGMLAKISEFRATGRKFNMQVDGLAASFAAFSLMYADSAKALDVTKFLFHRADSYISTPQEQDLLNSINADLKSKMLNKFDSKKFQKVTGYTIDQMFDPKQRLDIWIDAKQAKELGLIDDYVTTNPSDLNVKQSMDIMNSHMVSMGYNSLVTMNQNGKIENENKNKSMTLAELKQNNPDVYAEAVALGRAEENDRVNACMVFAHIDLDGVKKAIEAKTPLTSTQMAEFAMKQFSASALAAHASATDKKVVPEETKIVDPAAAKTEAEIKAEAFFSGAAKMAKDKLGIESK